MNLNFDASGHQPQSFEPIPAGWYNVMMVEGKETPTKNNAQTGNTYYAAQFEIIDGQFKGRKLFHNFNFVNTNEDAVRIAFDQLAAICHAVGVLKVQSVEQLFQKPLQAKVKLKAAVMEEDGVTEKYEAGNEIKGFKAIETGGGAAGATGGGLPEGFAAGASATPEAKQPATEAAKPSTPAAGIPSAAAAATPAPKEKKLVMTAKANGASAEQFRAHDAAWTDDLLVKEGYAEWIEVEAAKPSTPAAPSTPAVPATPATPQAESAPAEDDDTPPWLKAQ